MRFYEIWVASQSFHGQKPLTYSSDNEYQRGSVVYVPLQRKSVPGIVINEVKKPDFNTKSIVEIPAKAQIPGELLSLIDWMKDYYPAPIGQIVSLFVPSTVAQKGRRPKGAVIESNQTTPKLPQLTHDQASALQTIEKATKKIFLIHGDTGTGKTRVYVELAKQSLASDKSVIILTPEIGLTPQLVETFESQFPRKTVVIHSHLTPAEKREAWLHIANAIEPLIVIGARSALFCPLKNVGLIVMDEAHDTAYKQEQSPHYQASRVAAQLAKLHSATFVLGSGTPSISDYYTFKAKKLPIIRMTEQATTTDTTKSKIQIINIRNRDDFTRSAWLSNYLIDQIGKAYSRGEQSLLFLNRRGSARIVLCQNCGWQAICPKCDIPMTYHGDSHRLLCHTCGFNQSTPTSCPSCKSPDILYKSAGTKAIEKEVTRLFPEARIARFDSDNPKNERFDQNHQTINDGSVDILIGTQMLTKGLDLKNLSVVGVISADTALYFPDYTAEEITYQQITQVAGRVGRGHRAGIVIIQSNYPENSVIKAIENKNYSLFFDQQIFEREKFLFPPFSYILKLYCSRKSSAAAEKTLLNLHTFISTLPLSASIIGPSPAFKEKQNNKYNWQMIIKAKKRDQLTYIIERLPANISYDIDPSNLL